MWVDEDDADNNANGNDDEDADDEEEEEEDDGAVADSAEAHDGLSVVDASRHPPSSSSLDVDDDTDKDSSISPLVSTDECECMADAESNLLLAETRVSSADEAAGENDGNECCA